MIVDEVQDLSCVGLELLHELRTREADGLLLVGDGQQSIYPGGFTLAEAGISVVGRSVVLDRNYRNTDACCSTRCPWSATTRSTTWIRTR